MIQSQCIRNQSPFDNILILDYKPRFIQRKAKHTKQSSHTVNSQLLMDEANNECLSIIY